MPSPFTQGLGLDLSNHVNNLQVTAAAVGTTQALFAAAGAGLRNFLTALTLQNTSATAPGIVSVLDNATVIFQVQLPASMVNPVQLLFPTPLRGSQNVTMSLTLATTGSNTLVNAQGYSGPY